MTDKERTHAQKRLCGKSSAGVLLTIVLIISILLWAGIIAFNIWFQKTDFLPNDDILGIYIMDGMYFIVIVIIADLLFGYYSHRHILEQQYENLTQDKREMLLDLANRYGKNQKNPYKWHFHLWKYGRAKT